jgi:dipeptidyl-peptidase 4
MPQGYGENVLGDLRRWHSVAKMPESCLPTDPDASADLPFPRLSARTARFTLGEPRSFSVSPDGSRVTFLRSASGTQRSHSLWVFDVDRATETCVADPAVLLQQAGERLSDQERARRERSREQGAGVVAYGTDRDHRLAAFTLSGQVFVADLVRGAVTGLPTAPEGMDPRPDPTGRWVAYVADRTLRVVGVEGSDDRPLAKPGTDTETWGLAELWPPKRWGAQPRVLVGSRRDGASGGALR